jgi:predicted DNA-binding transcriptional regulator AlpA
MTKPRFIQPQDRLGMSRAEAAEYVGVGVTLFLEMVADGRMPPPRQINDRTVWARFEIEKAFENLPYAVQDNEPGEKAAGGCPGFG